MSKETDLAEIYFLMAQGIIARGFIFSAPVARTIRTGDTDNYRVEDPENHDSILLSSEDFYHTLKNQFRHRILNQVELVKFDDLAEDDRPFDDIREYKLPFRSFFGQEMFLVRRIYELVNTDQVEKVWSVERLKKER